MRMNLHAVTKGAWRCVLVCFIFCSGWAPLFASVMLTIRPQASNSVVISWPNTGSYTLQTNNNLGAANWVGYSGPIANTNGTNSVTIYFPTGNLFFRLKSADAGGFTMPASIPGLAYFWNYNDLTTGNTVSNWTDEIGGAVLSQSFNPAPVATALGVEFLNNNALTCPPITVSSNFSLWFVCRPTTIGGTELLFGDFASGNGLCLSNGLIDGRWSSDHVAGGAVPTGQVYPAPAFFDMVDAQGALYTNGVAVSGGIQQPSGDFAFNAVGNNVYTSENFGGEVEYIGLWTNYALTAGDVANLHNWLATNGVTNVLNGLVAWWRLDENGGTNVADSSGNGNNGTFAGSGITWASGVNGSALNFSGSGQVNTANCADNLSNMTVSFWIKGTNFGTPSAILNKNGPGGSDTGQGWGFFSDSTTNIAAYTQDSLGNFIETPHNAAFPIVGDDRWHFIACTFGNLNTLQMYVDAVLITGPYVGDGGVTSAANSGVVVLGGDSANVEMFGAMDDVRIYSRILSQHEILNLYRWRGQP
jgi:Concanavalin A-like lectin/glucanases superfamily